MVSLAWIAMAYMLGCIPFGLVVAKAMCGIDPRKDGSCNTGATNVARLCGFKYGVLALVLDLSKGLVPVAIAATFSDSPLFLALTALAPIVGHCYSVFLSGRGGKAVATTAGAFLALAPGVALVAIALCIAVIAWSGFVSLGSLMLVTALPVLLLLTGQFTYMFLGLGVMALVYWRHRENIARLVKGEEKSWRKSDKQKNKSE